MRLMILLPPLSIAFACAEPTSRTPAVVDDAFPPILGLAPAEDLDPAVGAVEYELVVAETDVELVPGKPTKMMTYNGIAPGPLLQANVGDHVKITAANHLTEPTTIHWHGLRVPNEMDGVVNGQLQPIAPGETFTYEFTVPDAGTFWYHPHIRPNVQVEHGLQGMFVVHEKPELAPDVDADRAFVLDDIYLNDDGSIVPPGGGMEVMMGRVGNHFIVNGTLDMDTVALGAGRVERWRIVNTSNAYTQELRFNGMSAREIGADGGLWPQESCRDATSIVLPAGARTELEVRLGDGTEPAMVSRVYYVDDNNVLRHEDLPVASVLVDKTLDVAAGDERPGYTASAPLDLEDPTTPMTKLIKMSGYQQNGVVHFTMNGRSWPEYEDWRVPQGQLQVIEVQNALMGDHPFHLHGTFFQILRRNGRPADEPGLRDTVLLQGNERVDIATRFDNPGMWMYHCHILEHEENGLMGMVTVEPVEGMD